MQHQNQGYGQSQGQNQHQDWQAPNSGSKMQDTQTPAGQNAENVRPEVENPQPIRKEEEPIVADTHNGDESQSYTRDNDNRNVNNAGSTTANSDYTGSNIGFRNEGNSNEKHNDSQAAPSMSNDESKEWKEQQMGAKS